MNDRLETPFENIESAAEYVGLLLEAIEEAQEQVEKEIALAANPRLARRKEALQLVRYKLDKLSAHMAGSRRVLNDLRTLRRLLFEERPARGEISEHPAERQPLAGRFGE